ncbi:hypothetical protein SNOG_00823 [Parastagonospora nodorum SN15]|uniref:Uncharacterized protein n=1 Tax=Phaeosphaeria nodorum (strain SN15 / ATCC MYA-4574 / FGSC 10173) TaxID=321614 RepID=Q0V591_PHANO|nr:hypothetical protein SNOG_00823 [Parastagonospora nodorum SN15]EAT92318.1 hypothetical protein SNOG_00823 [Parastagonospora nodorum SN15]
MTREGKIDIKHKSEQQEHHKEQEKIDLSRSRRQESQGSCERSRDCKNPGENQPHRSCTSLELNVWPRAKTICPPAPYNDLINCTRPNTWVHVPRVCLELLKPQQNVFHALTIFRPENQSNKLKSKRR